MKKNILNRAMFRQVKSPAYGTGISANLVSDEQRQRYNSGGRVGFYTDYKGGPVFMGQMGDPIRDYWDASMGPIIQSGEPGLIWDPDANEGEGGYTKGEGIYKVTGAEYGDPEKMDYIPTTYGEMKELTATGRIPNIKNIDEAYMKAQAGSKRDALERSMGYDIGTPVEGGGTKFKVKPTAADRVFGEPRKSIFGPLDEKKEMTDMPDPHVRRDTKFDDVIEDTEIIDTEPTAYETLMSELDKSSEEKKKIGRGKAYMQAAAAAVKWSGAPTAEKRSAAIAEGLTQVGETGMKAATEGMDLKDRVKILKTMEDVKGKHKMDVWESKLDKYYSKSLELAGKEFDFKKLTADALKEDLPPREIYKSFAGKGILSDPDKKAEILSDLFNKKIPVASDDKEKKQFSSPRQ